MDHYLSEMRAAKISGAPVADWLAFFSDTLPAVELLARRPETTTAVTRRDAGPCYSAG